MAGFSHAHRSRRLDVDVAGPADGAPRLALRRGAPAAAARRRPAPGAEARIPAPGVLSAVADGGRTFVEVQANPFPLRGIVREVDFGLPTFYLVFDAGSDLVPFAEGDAAPRASARGGGGRSEHPLRRTGPRRARSPALVEPDPGCAPGGGPPAWQPFADAVAALAGGADRPILVLDHRGAPLESGRFEIESGPQTATAQLIASDRGDLQRAVARMHDANPGTMPLTTVLPAGGGAASVRPLLPNADVQLARLEDGAPCRECDPGHPRPAPPHVHEPADLVLAAARSGCPDPARRLHARQQADAVRQRPRVLRPPLPKALGREPGGGPGGGLHLVGGWQTFPDDELTVRQAGGARGMPLTLAEAAELIGGRGGATRFLSPKFIQLDPGSPVEVAELTLVLRHRRRAVALAERRLPPHRPGRSDHPARAVRAQRDRGHVDHQHGRRGGRAEQGRGRRARRDGARPRAGMGRTPSRSRTTRSARRSPASPTTSSSS